MKKIVTILFCVLICTSAFAQKKKKKSVNYTEEQALEYIDDYFKFYNSNEVYENPQARKISSNVFYVKVETCSGGNETCYKTEYYEGVGSIKQRNEPFWHSQVLVLTINSNGKYTVKEKY